MILHQRKLPRANISTSYTKLFTDVILPIYNCVKGRKSHFSHTYALPILIWPNPPQQMMSITYGWAFDPLSHLSTMQFSKSYYSFVLLFLFQDFSFFTRLSQGQPLVCILQLYLGHYMKFGLFILLAYCITSRLCQPQ